SRAIVRSHGRKPLPRRDDAGPARIPASAAGNFALCDSDPRAVAVRRGHPPGRWSDGRVRAQRGARDPALRRTAPCHSGDRLTISRLRDPRPASRMRAPPGKGRKMTCISKTLSPIGLVLGLLVAGAAGATTFVIDATQSGWYTQTDASGSSNQNYLVGMS